MKQDTEKFHKKIRDLKIQLSILNGKIGLLRTQLQAKEDLIIALKNTWAKQENRVEEMTNLLEEYCPEVLKKKQGEWRLQHGH